MYGITIDVLLDENSKISKIPKLKYKIKDRNKEYNKIVNNIDINSINIDSFYFRFTNKNHGNVKINENILNDIKINGLLFTSFEEYQKIKIKEYYGCNKLYALIHNFDNIFTIHKNFISNENNNIRLILFLDDNNVFCILFQYNNHDLYVSMLNYMEERLYYYKKTKTNKFKNFFKNKK